MKKAFSLTVILLLLAACCRAGSAEMVNLSHLDQLEFQFVGEDGKEYTGWAIYAEPIDRNNPDGGYRQVEAPGEGYACVDDVARIAVLCLDHFEKTGDREAFDRAVKALEFVLYMEDGRGDFYNFTDKKGRINRTGITSRTGLDWWSARAFWALGKGIRIVGDGDKNLTEKMEQVYARTLNRLVENRKNPVIDSNIKEVYEKLKITPGHLVSDSGAITSIFTLGLLEKYKTGKDPAIEELIENFCSSMVKLEETGTTNYPLTGFHYPTIWNRDMVHLYGNRQVQALAEAGKIFHNREWMESAKREADTAYPLLLTSWGPVFALSPGPEIYPQLAYSVETVVSNLNGVYEATGSEKYSIMAGLFGAWFLGSNPSGEPMLIMEKGRCYDGIDGGVINRNAGAESVVEALMAMQALNRTPGEKYIDYVREKPENPNLSGPVILHGESFKTVSGNGVHIKRTYTGGNIRNIMRMKGPGEIESALNDAAPTRYRVYVVYRNAGPYECKVSVTMDQHGADINLPRSMEDYHFCIIFAGTVLMKDGGDIRIAVENKDSDGEIYIDSVILVPQLQHSTWKNRNSRLSMVMNVFPYQAQAPLDIIPRVEVLEDIIISGQEPPSIYLAPNDWVIIRDNRKNKYDGRLK